MALYEASIPNGIKIETIRILNLFNLILVRAIGTTTLKWIRNSEGGLIQRLGYPVRIIEEQERVRRVKRMVRLPDTELSKGQFFSNLQSLNEHIPLDTSRWNWIKGSLNLNAARRQMTIVLLIPVDQIKKSSGKQSFSPTFIRKMGFPVVLI